MLVDVTFLAPKQTLQTANNQELRMFVPEKYVLPFEGGSAVWVADQSAGVARRRSVRTGVVSNGGLIEIEGLALGTRIITTDIDGLKDGQRIRVTGEDPSD
jgi:hypothetical protein